jgi:hypothetical protein
MPRFSCKLCFLHAHFIFFLKTIFSHLMFCFSYRIIFSWNLLYYVRRYFISSGVLRTIYKTLSWLCAITFCRVNCACCLSLSLQFENIKIRHIFYLHVAIGCKHNVFHRYLVIVINKIRIIQIATGYNQNLSNLYWLQSEFFKSN